MRADDLEIPMPRMVPAEPGYRVRRAREPIDAGTRRLMLTGGGISALLLLIAGAWALSGHRPAEVPVVQADSRPLRTKPVDAGGMQVEGQNDSILSGATDGKDALAAPPEVPAPQTLKSEAAQLLAARQAAPPAPPPAPATTRPNPVQRAAAPDAPLTATPAIVAQPVPAAPASARPAAVPAPASPATPASAESAPLHGAAVQLAALGSEAGAMTEWHRLSQRMPDLLGTREPSVQRVESHGKTFWRLRTGGFADIAEATAFCAQVRARGGACTLARF